MSIFGLDLITSDYFDEILYYPDHLFKDGAHLKDPAILGENVLAL
jgi:hypothetical protein